MSLQHALVAARAAASKTSEETVVLDVGELIGITDYFVIASGRNDRQVRAIVDEVTRKVREVRGVPPRQVEGLQAAEWVLVDYGDFVVHVFNPEARQYYALERLWSFAPRVSWEADLASPGARV
ncbi:MAG TPA: ribosome silencing factor [Acidimicrobiales bacterium]|nr:ribosome silencing factor [Acidimicrobiales bacterium]